MNRHRAVVPALLAALVLALASAVSAQLQVPLSPTKIPQFVEPLNVLDLTGVTGIPVATGNTVNLSICEFQTNVLPAGALGGGTPAPATWVWGYNIGANTCAPPTAPPGTPPRSYLGPVVIAERGTPTTMNFWNKLPDASVAKVKAYTTSTDQTLIWGDPLSLNAATGARQLDGTATWNGLSPYPEANECWAAAQNLAPGALMPPACNNNYGYLAAQPTTSTYVAPVPAAVHLHGGEVPAGLDGGPDSWWTPNGIYGHGYYSKGGIADAAAGKATYVYPNGQEAAPIWFHDHMLGATRLNVYAGIAGGYVVTEPPASYAPGLHPLGLSDRTTGALSEATVPLIIQDRMFDTAGQLFFPNLGINPEHPFWVPEFVGDVIVVNGKSWPFFNVQPKRYRFIFLNGSNARAYELYLMSKTTGLKGPSLWVIGNDQGLLDAPQEINPNLKPNDKLAMMPGERYEVVIDFSTVAGQVVEMRNTARTPYVAGAPVNGNTTGRIIRFNVSAVPVADTTFDPAAPGAVVRAHPMVRLTTQLGTTPVMDATIHKVRRLTVNEALGAGGPLEVLVNNTLYDGSKPRPYGDFTDITTMWNTTWYSELPYEGETELWEIVNLTADAHPMHPHLVAFQVLNRQGLDVKAYTTAYNLALTNAGLPLDGGGPPYNYNNSGSANASCSATPPGRGDTAYIVDPATGLAQCVLGGNPDPAAVVGALVGLPVPPMPQEIGWKDTVQALPNMITRVLVRFAKADLPANTPADSAGYDFDPNHGHGYVWHCHIVDHEDNEMMRPFSVFPNGQTRTFCKCDPITGQPPEGCTAGCY